MPNSRHDQTSRLYIGNLSTAFSHPEKQWRGFIKYQQPENNRGISIFRNPAKEYIWILSAIFMGNKEMIAAIYNPGGPVALQLYLLTIKAIYPICLTEFISCRLV